MRRTSAFIAFELRTQARSLRFRVAAVTYAAAGSLPAVLLHLRRSDAEVTLGGATYAGETLCFLPLLTGVLAILLSLDGIGRERASNAWTTVALTDLTNAGYLLRRWIALLAVIVPLTAVPVLAAAGLAAAGAPSGMEPAVFWGPWLVHILPLAVLGTTLGLGLGTLGGGAMGTFALAALILAGFPSLASEALARLGYGFRSPMHWLDIRSFNLGLDRIARGLELFETESQAGWFPGFPLVASEAGFDLRSFAEQNLADGLLGAALAAAVLGLAVTRLRRTRPDLPPWTVRQDHPLRNFLVTFGRLRDALAPDPALAPADRLCIAIALLLAAAAGAAHVARADRYDETAWRQVRTEVNPPRSMARDVLPGSWRVVGTIAADGAVELRVAGTMRNTGAVPRDWLAFTLNPELDVAEATADVGRVRATHVWDRLTVQLDPPLAPGEGRELRFRLAGRPAATQIPGRPKPERLVDDGFGGHQRTRFGRDLIDFSASFKIPAVSGYRVELRAEDLLPVPRYGPWTRNSEYGVVRIAPEVFFPEAEVSLALAVPRGLFLADSCGGQARGGRLESRCKLPVADLAVLGGRRYRTLGGAGTGTTVAVFPSHRAAGELHLGFLARSSRMIGEAWPGLGDLGGMTVLEWPAPGIHDRHGATASFWQYFWDEEEFVDVRGRVILLRERDLIRSRPLEPESLVAEIVSSRLARRRRIDADQQLFFLWLYRTLALQRLGLGPQGGAVLALDPKDLPAVLGPALSPPSRGYWRIRFPALITALENRTGREPLRAAVEELLASTADRPVTFDEFEPILRRHAREPVDGMIRDFFRAGKLPELVLEDVRFHRAGTGWRATGRVRNRSEGEAICRVVLTASVAPVETRVTVGTRAAVPFTLETPDRPQAVFLDPDRECHRLDGGPGQDRAYFKATLRAQGEKVPQEVPR
jgi:hypothetical protein